MLKIKFISDTPHNDKKDAGWTWYNLWRRMAKDYANYTWNDIKVVTPDNKADLNIVINHPSSQKLENFDRAKTITYQLEPKVVRRNCWGKYNNPQIDMGFLYCHNIDSDHMCIDWNVKYSYEELQTLKFKKTKLFSTVQTWKDYYPEKQYQILEALFNKLNKESEQGLPFLGDLKLKFKIDSPRPEDLYNQFRRGTLEF